MKHLPKGVRGSREMLLLIANTILFAGIYFMLNRAEFRPAFWIYAGALAALSLWFVIYNRGFSLRGVTEDMLPADWSEEKKQAVLRERDERFQKSRLSLTVILPLLFSFVSDYVWMWLQDLLNLR